MEDLPDHEPPTPAPPLPPPFDAPEAAVSTVVRIAQFMAQAKKATKRLQVTPDEALDRMLADHDRRAAKKKLQVTPDEALDRCLAQHDRKATKKKKQVTPDEAMDLLLAEHDRKAAKVAKKAVGRGTLAIQDQEEEIESQPAGALVSKKAKIVKQADMKPRKKAQKSAAGVSGSQRRKRYAA